MAPRTHIRLLGPPNISGEADATTKIGLGKPFGLLAYLLTEGPTSRDAVIALLWGDVPEGRARNAFRQALHRLRTALGENVIPHDPDILRISTDREFESDVTAFDGALRTGNAEAAVALYGGDFLAGVDLKEPAFDEWVAAKRERYRAKYADALRASIQLLSNAGENEEALERANRFAAASPTDPDATLLRASMLLGAGRRGEAMQALREFSRQYEAELGAAPPASIREMELRLRRTPSENQGQSSRARLEIVGRAKELAMLLAAWREVGKGQRGIVFLHGPGGIGKTRILEEFFARANDLGSPLLLFGRERAPGSGISYASIAEALRGTLDAPGVAGTSQHLLAEASRILPQLRDRFSLPAPPDVHDDAGRLRFFEGVAALLDSAAYEQPVCLALDDFQNASPSTLALTYYLTDRLRGAQILFLLSGRWEPRYIEATKQLDETLFGSAVEASGGDKMEIVVGPLPHDAAMDLARNFSSGKLENDILDTVVAMSEGFPFQIRDLVERAIAGAPLGQAPIPLKTVLWARLQRCSPAEQRLFVVAALLDRPASIRLLAGASHLSEGNALDAALALEKEGLLLQRDDGVVPAHDLAAELALEGAGPAGRALLAGWAADALVQDGTASDAELANLFAAAGRRNEVFTHSRRAGYAAASAGAVDDAVRHFDAAISTAVADQDREEVRRIREGLRGGSLRITGEVSPTKPQPAFEEPVRVPPMADTLRDSGETETIRNTDWPVEPIRKSRRRSHQLLIGAGGIIAALLVVRAVSVSREAVPGTSLSDTLVVAEELSPHQTSLEFVTGPVVALTATDGNSLTGPASWADSLRAPWINAKVSPNRQFVAVEKTTAAGSDLYVISIDRRDTIALAVGPGDDISEGWSPDGKWLLATRGTTKVSGSYDSDLYAYPIFERGREVALDTAASRSVVDAAWSPDGTRVAWTARSGVTHQQDVFVSDADGRNLRNISDNPTEDYSIAWSPSGAVISFTSERTGFAEVYSMDLAGASLRRLSFDGAHADHAGYSPDGRWIAYESTRGGAPAVYVMPAFGGKGYSALPANKRVTFTGWRGPSARYLDHIAISATDVQLPGTAQQITVRGRDQAGRPISSPTMRLSVLSPSLGRLDSDASVTDSAGVSRRATLTALADGLLKIEANAGGWRADTAFVSVGSKALSVLSDDFENGLNPTRWRKLGVPAAALAPRAGEHGTGGLVARSDRKWESGILSTAVFPVRAGLKVDAWVRAPFAANTVAGSTFEISLVAADPAAVVDSIAPELFRLAGVSWSGEAGRMRYSVARESYTEPVGGLQPGSAHNLTLRVEQDSTVAFYLDGSRRWKSTLKVTSSGENSRAQLWLASRASGSAVTFDNISINLAGSPPQPQGSR